MQHGQVEVQWKGGGDATYDVEMPSADALEPNLDYEPWVENLDLLDAVAVVLVAAWRFGPLFAQYLSRAEEVLAYDFEMSRVHVNNGGVSLRRTQTLEGRGLWNSREF